MNNSTANLVIVIEKMTDVMNGILAELKKLNEKPKPIEIVKPEVPKHLEEKAESLTREIELRPITAEELDALGRNASPTAKSIMPLTEAIAKAKRQEA